MLFLNYAPFLQGRLEKEEQKEAFAQFVDFLDKLEDPPFTEKERQILLKAPEEINVEMIETSVAAKINAIQNVDEWIEKNQEAIKRYQNFKESDEYKTIPIIQISEKLKTFFQESGYYDVVIPLIRKMSPDYDSYYLQLVSANEKLLLCDLISETNVVSCSENIEEI